MIPYDLIRQSRAPVQLIVIANGIRSPVMTNSHQEAPATLPAENILRPLWTHWIERLQRDDSWKLALYESECLRSVRQPQRQIGSMRFDRTGLSANAASVAVGDLQNTYGRLNCNEAEHADRSEATETHDLACPATAPRRKLWRHGNWQIALETHCSSHFFNEAEPPRGMVPAGGVCGQPKSLVISSNSPLKLYHKATIYFYIH